MKNYNKTATKKRIYGTIVKLGLSFLSKLFPGIHMSTPLKPGERFLEYPFVVSRLPDNKNAKILDIGCAGNFFPLIVAALGYDVTACDIRPYEILNNLKFKNFKFIQTDICKNPLDKGTFDIITCISVLEHIGLGGRYGAEEDQNGDFKMVEAIYKLLKNGGQALITVPYGIAEIFAPYHRIYDLARVKKIEACFSVIEEKFYCYDKNGDWKECSAEGGQLIRGSVNRQGLALLCLEKRI